jgi:hypothetical protein
MFSFLFRMVLEHSSHLLLRHLSCATLAHQPVIGQHMLDQHAWCLYALLRQLLLDGQRNHIVYT